MSKPTHNTGRTLLRHRGLLKRDERNILRRESTLKKCKSATTGFVIRF